MSRYYRSDRAIDPSQSDELEVGMLADQWGAPANWVPEFTSKNRLKISNYETIFYNTFQYGKETDVWDESTTNGGTATHDPSRSGVILAVTNTLGSKVIRQTKNVMPYIPGRASTISFAIRLETPTPGIRRRFGIWNGTDGAYFEDDGTGTYYCCIANSDGDTPTLERVSRANWNGDKLDGNGRSGITANPDAQHLIQIEYEWYGAGRVRFQYVINGESHTIHQFDHANRITSVWSKTPFLPVRCEIENTTGGQVGTSFKLYQGSNSLASEGFTGRIGTLQNIGNSITGTTLTNANTYYPLISIRLKSTALQGVVLPRKFQVATIDNTNVFYKILVNATLTGASWTDMPDSNSFVQYDTSATAVSGGNAIDSGFSIAGNSDTITFDPYAKYQLGRSSLGTVSDTLTICAASNNTNKSAICSLTWIEQR